LINSEAAGGFSLCPGHLGRRAGSLEQASLIAAVELCPFPPIVNVLEGGGFFWPWGKISSFGGTKGQKWLLGFGGSDLERGKGRLKK